MKIDNLQGSLDFSGITDYSKDVQPGFLFAVLSSGDQTGHYIQEALSKGATHILTSDDIYQKYESLLTQTQVFTHTCPRLMFSQIVKSVHTHQPENIVAVTGTNGKSSTVNFFRQMGNFIGNPAASIGTLGVSSPWELQVPSSTLTTPSPLILHHILKDLKNHGCTHVAMEASSHGLDQYRLHSVTLRAAAFTNFTQDHLDYHQSMENYFHAKLKLFKEILPPGATAVLNSDIPEYPVIKEACQNAKIKILSYGKSAQDLQILDYSRKNSILNIQGKKYTTHLSLFGEFQLYNALAALGLMMACGEEDTQKLIDTFPKLEGVAGRMQFAGTTAKGAQILIDYAHTPDAVENILKAIAPEVCGKLWIIIGCGGNRDPLKRPLMGAIASKFADQVIVTDDNPRWEDPASIRAQVLEGATNAKEIGNRLDAIAYAIDKMENEDLLIIAGKGHETQQIIRDQIIPFNDLDVVQTILRGQQ